MKTNCQNKKNKFFFIYSLKMKYSRRPRSKLYKKKGKKPSSFLKKAYKYGKTAASVAGKVATIAKMLNAEKKRIDTRVCSDQIIGQCVGNTDTGAVAMDITPFVSQGVTVSTRNGSSIKLCSLQARVQVRAQSALTTSAKVKIYIVQIKGAPILFGGLQQSLWRFLDTDSITGLHDYNSIRNPDWFSSYRVLATKTLYIKPEQYSGQQMIADAKINLRLNTHVRFDADTNNLASGQILMFAVSDTGNAALSGASTLSNIANTAPLTGQILSMNTRYYYYDN